MFGVGLIVGVGVIWEGVGIVGIVGLVVFLLGGMN